MIEIIFAESSSANPFGGQKFYCNIIFSYLVVFEKIKL